jgi:hypothetical protein
MPVKNKKATAKKSTSVKSTPKAAGTRAGTLEDWRAGTLEDWRGAGKKSGKLNRIGTDRDGQ